MTFRKKTTLILGSTFLGLSLVVFLVAQFVLLKAPGIIHTNDAANNMQSLLNTLLVGMFLLGLAYAGINRLLLERWVLSPLKRFSNTVKQIEGEADHAARLPVVGKDELSELAVVINHLLASLQQKSRTLEHSLVQIRTAAEISWKVADTQDPDTLIQQVVDLIRERFKLYFVGYYSLDLPGLKATLLAGTGEAGQKMIAERHCLEINGASLVGAAILDRQTKYAYDADQIPFRHPYLPRIRSELAIPLILGEQNLGALTIQSSQSNAFDHNMVTMFQGIAVSLATVIGNAYLLQQVQANLDEFRNLYQLYLSRAWTEGEGLVEGLEYTYERGEISQTEELQQSKEFPLNLRDQRIGNMILESDRLASLPEDRSFIEAVTREAAKALENLRLLEETRRVAERERLLIELSDKVRSTTTVNSVLETALLELGRVLHASEGFIGLSSQDIPVARSHVEIKTSE